MTKAFDMVDHGLLLHKLVQYGFGNNLISWLSHFLTHRTQSVKLGECIGATCDVLSGVVQGSVLGPMLFSLFINDVMLSIHDATLLLYADDIKLIMPLSDSHACTRLQEDINRLMAWASSCGMSFNAQKCTALHYGRGNSRRVYTINSVPLQTADCVKDLGLLRDGNLDYTSHINASIAKGHGLCAALLRSFATRDASVVVLAYKTFVRPVIEFGSTLSHPRTQYLSQRIERIQKLFTKRVRGLHDVPYADRLLHLNLQSLRSRRVLSDLIIMYKIIHGMIDIQLSDIGLSINANITRAAGYKLVLPYPRTNMLKSSFAYRTGSMWNMLPTNVIAAPTYRCFVARLHEYINNDNVIVV